MVGSKRETKEGGVPCWISVPRLMSGSPTGRLPPTKKGGTVGPPQKNLFPSFGDSSKGKSHNRLQYCKTRIRQLHQFNLTTQLELILPITFG